MTKYNSTSLIVYDMVKSHNYYILCHFFDYNLFSKFLASEYELNKIKAN